MGATGVGDGRSSAVEGILRQWGTPLFYPFPERTSNSPEGSPPNFRGRGGGGRGGGSGSPSANDIRAHIRGIVGGAPQVMVRITGSSRGMAGIRQHLRYITASGERPLVDDQDRQHCGLNDVRDLADAWEISGSLIPQHGGRREAFQIVLDMPPGTDPDMVADAAREFAHHEFAAHEFAWALHTHQGHPHVHLIVKAEARDFTRLDPRLSDLHRWRTSFAQSLRSRGIAAEATRRVVHGQVKDMEPLWASRARAAGTLRQERRNKGRVTLGQQAMAAAFVAWGHIHNALANSPEAADRDLARQVKQYLAGTPMARHIAGRAQVELEQQRQQREPAPTPQQLRPGRAAPR